MTLAETLVALSIFVIIMVAVATFQVNVFSYQKSVAGSFETSQDAQALLKIVTKEIRSMTPSANGAYPIANAATNTLTFFSDVNNDGKADQVTYTLVGSTLYKAVITPSGSLAVYNVANQATTSLVTNVHNASSTKMFQFYDQNYDGTTAPLTLPVDVTTIRMIKVTLTLDVDPNRSPIPVSYSVQIQLRDLKTNL